MEVEDCGEQYLNNKELSLIPIEFKVVYKHPLLDILNAPLNYWFGL